MADTPTTGRATRRRGVAPLHPTVGPDDRLRPAVDLDGRGGRSLGAPDQLALGRPRIDHADAEQRPRLGAYDDLEPTVLIAIWVHASE